MVSKTIRDKKRYLYFFFYHIFKKKILEEKIGIKNYNHKYAGKEFLNRQETNDLISEYIRKGDPFALVRPGNGESAFALLWEEEKLFGKQLYTRKSDNFSRNMLLYNGIVDEYQMIFRKDISDADIFAIFPEYLLESYLPQTYCVESKVINAWNMGPINTQRPWTDALGGKKVLVVSQFADFLLEQYSKREKLYSGEWMFPEMELIPVKSIWYFPGNETFATWFDALNYLYTKIMEHDFDIALLSCGPFAIHLAPMLKRAGKQAIQYAGELQMLFGIRGARWDDNPVFKKYFNESWIRITKEQVGISEEESKNMDGGVCYW